MGRYVQLNWLYWKSNSVEVKNDTYVNLSKYTFEHLFALLSFDSMYIWPKKEEQICKIDRPCQPKFASKRYQNIQIISKM